MERHFHALHVVLDVDDDAIVLADLDAGPGDHSVGCQDSALDSVGQDALAMTPHGVGCIGGANLASAVKGVEKIAEKFRSEFSPLMARRVERLGAQCCNANGGIRKMLLTLPKRCSILE